MHKVYRSATVCSFNKGKTLNTFARTVCVQANSQFTVQCQSPLAAGEILAKQVTSDLCRVGNHSHKIKPIPATVKAPAIKSAWVCLGFFGQWFGRSCFYVVRLTAFALPVFYWSDLREGFIMASHTKFSPSFGM